jgi:copper transport protein
VVLAAILMAFAAVLAGPLAIPPTAARVAGHSGLVAVVPPETAGGDLRLVFSEPVESRFSGADLISADGSVVTANVGRIDSSDAHVMLIAEPAAAASEELSVAWRALSAADGHVTSGAFPVPSPGSAGGGAGTATRGHTGGHLSLEVLAKILAYGGLLLAVGLLPFARLVVRPATGAIPRGLALTQANALIAAAVGGALLLAVTDLELASAGTVVDPWTYVAGNRVGVLLGLRAAVPLIGGFVAALLVRRDALERASEAAAAAGLTTIVLTVLSGHAAAYASPVPMAVDLVHVLAASVWVGGLIGFAGMIGAETPLPIGSVRAMIPRFSALAMSSIALLGLTGLYAAWLETEDWTTVAPPYSLGLAIKVVIVGAAFAVGAVNYLDGGRDLRLGGGISRRIVLEAGIAAVVIVATASLTSGDPPSLTRPVAIVPTSSDGLVSLSLAPGRSGPNLVVVSGPVPVGATVELTPVGGAGQATSVVLGSLDALPGAAAAGVRGLPGGHVGATLAIPAGRWNAAVVLSNGGTAVARFSFALDWAGVTEGREAPGLPPPLLAGIGLVLSALLGAGLLARGLVPPLVDRRAGRVSLAAFSLVAATLGVAILAVGPRL